MTYQLLLTTLGQQKIAAAANAGSTPVSITHFAVGQGVNVDFSQRLDQQVLVSKRYQGTVQGVTKTAVAGQYEITCIVPQNQGGWAIREIGLIDSAGDLIWVGQVPEVQKPVASSNAAVDYRIKAVISIDNPNFSLVIDANVIAATQQWALVNFVPISHLDDANPHDQYVLNSTYETHDLQNSNEHNTITEWQIEHLDITQNPHPQYVNQGEYESKIGELLARINMISAAVGGNSSDGDYSVALIDLYAVNEQPQGFFNRRKHTTLIEKRGYVFPSYTNMATLDIALGVPDRRSYSFVVQLPAEYDSLIHRVVATGGNSHQVLPNSVVFRITTDVEPYTHNLGGDKGTETRYRTTLRGNLRVELFSATPPPPISGELVGLLDVTYSDTARSANDVSADGIVTVNNMSGYSFGYPSTVNLVTPITDTPSAYNLITKVLLPVEYDPTKHTLTVINSAGDYEINQADNSIEFSSAVTSVLQADNEVLDTLEATFHIEVRNQ